MRVSSPLVLGIGDDAAVYRPGTGRDLLLTTDLIIESVHFNRSSSPPLDIGYKAIAVNVSDIAAMGGIPRAYLVSLALPSRIPLAEIDQLYRGMKQGAHACGLSLAGGNTARSPDKLSVGVMVIGEVEHGKAVTRSGARDGDHLFVTGTLGNAAAGYRLLHTRFGAGKKRAHPRGKDGRTLLKGEAFLVGRHRKPPLRWREGRLLARVASAMIDLSDGLSSDLCHLCDESGVGAVLSASAVPLSGPLSAFCRRYRMDPLEYALHGGEDYELLFTVPERRLLSLRRLARKHRITVTGIGRIVHRREGRWLERSGKRIPLLPGGYDHLMRKGR